MSNNNDSNQDENNSHLGKTRFYRHYKNKPYKLIGTVRHSETLEEMALYESLYENKLGRLWVRPKEMFFENINLNGESKPRFEKINFTFKIENNYSEDILENISAVYKKCFEQGINLDKIKSKLSCYNSIHIVAAYDENQMIGFKIGYKLDQSTFYSWLGAVLPDYQELGIGTELMRLQHKWCSDNKITKIETRTQNQYKKMIKLNLKFGFDIVGTLLEKGKPVKILMEKNII